MPQTRVDIHYDRPMGKFQGFRHTIGHGGINNFPLPPRVKEGLAALKPRLVRTFIQEYFHIMDNPNMEYDFSLLDPYLESLVVEGAKLVACICLKPPCLFPSIDQTVYMPNDTAKWQALITALVRRYTVEKGWVSHWEIANEPDIGESGGCPYLMAKPEEYNAYYRVTAEAILEAAPDVKIGGPAVANAKSPLIEGLLAYCKETGLPLDFVTWHVYSDDPADHAGHIERNLALIRQYYPNNPPETMVTEMGKGFDQVCVEESAFDSYRPAAVIASVFAMLDTGIDYTFYYHTWDQVFVAEQFASFYKNLSIMAVHWNNIPHRMGLFGVCGEARPIYYAYRMLEQLAGVQVEASSSQTDLRVKATVAKDGTARAMLVNYDLRETRDMVAVLHYHGLPPGLRRLTVCRADTAYCAETDSLELTPAEQRFVDIQGEFYCNVYCPADSVTMVSLEPIGVEDIQSFNDSLKGRI